MMARLLRMLAIVIAVAAVIDPAITRQRPVFPVIEITVAPGFEELGQRVESFLRPRFSVVAAPVAQPAARLVVGGFPGPVPLPEGPAASGAETVPGLVVLADPSSPRPAIAALRAPLRAPLNARVPVDVTVRAGAGGAAVELELTVDGLPADRMTLLADASSSSLQASLSFLPSRPGAHHLRVSASRVGGGAGTDIWADTLVTVDDEPWRVLVYDPRPSWPSTFVRRVLDRDARFEVVTRVAVAPDAIVTSAPTSPRASTPPLPGPSAPRSPGLGTAPSLRDFDVVVVGAPDALPADEVETLRQFVRGRGGSVVLLIAAEPGGAAELAGAVDWDESLTSAPAELVSDQGQSGLWASEVVVPSPLPLGARVLARIEDAGNIAPVVWSRPAGAGRLVVSGALDAWRFRAAVGARFDDFWRAVIAEVATAAPPVIELEAAPRVGRPGDAVNFDVTVRDVALAPEPTAEVAARAWLDVGQDTVAVRLWPRAKGRLSGQLSLPEAPGSYRLHVETGDGYGATADLIVATDALPAAAPDAALLETWAAAHGGVAVSEAGLDDLAAALDAAVDPELAPFVWYPMRSAWWVVPFGLALGGEWWIRRRRGER